MSPPYDEPPHPWGSDWRDWALLPWFIGISVAAFILGTVNSSPGHEIPTATWAAEAALVGVGAGVLLGLFTRHRPWQGYGGVLVLGGAAVYSLAYAVAAARGYGGGDSGDAGWGLVFVVIGITCLAPMEASAAAAHALRTAALGLAPKHDRPQPPRIQADSTPISSTSEQPPPDQPPFWPPPPDWKPTSTEPDEHKQRTRTASTLNR